MPAGTGTPVVQSGGPPRHLGGVPLWWVSLADCGALTHRTADRSKSDLVPEVRLGSAPHSLGMSSKRRRHLSINFKKACRHRGHPFARQVAYIGRSKAYDPRTATTYNFSRKNEIEAFGMIGFKGTIEDLIDQVVLSEPVRRTRVVEGREITVALAKEFTAAERLALARRCAKYFVRQFQVAVLFGVHLPDAKGDQSNWHIHFLITSRRVVGRTRLGEKTRELDSLVTGGGHVRDFRAWWTGIQNKALRKGGHQANLEHRSFETLGIEGAPGKHQGVRNTAIRRRRFRKLSVPNVPVPVRTIPPLPTPRTATQTAPAPAPSIIANPHPTAPQSPVQLELFAPQQGDCPRDDRGFPILRTPVPAPVLAREPEAPAAPGIGNAVRIRKLRTPSRTKDGPTPAPG